MRRAESFFKEAYVLQDSGHEGASSLRKEPLMNSKNHINNVNLCK